MAWNQRDMSAPDDMTPYEDEPADDYSVAVCGGCGLMTPVCCDTADGPYCAVCCRRSHGIVGRSNYTNMDCGWDV